MLAPFLIALPQGLVVSGVTTWALRLASALTERERRVMLAVHPAVESQRTLAADLPPGVERLEINMPDATPGTLAHFQQSLPQYNCAVRDASQVAGAPVVLSPNLLGDCYALAAALCMTEQNSVRTIGVQHADIEYDARVLAHYEPIVHAFVGVSRRLADSLARRLPSRRGDVHHIPHAVAAPDAPPAREPLGARPLRLVYTGRIERQQKRIDALLLLSDELTRRRVDHELTLIGDGPALADVRRSAESRPAVTTLGALPPHEVQPHLDCADCFVLASRYEGLSVAMLEAMARGCAPVVTNVASGAGEAITRNENGLLVDLAENASDAAVAEAIADAMASLDAQKLGALQAAARETVRERFAPRAHADRWSSLIDRIAEAPPRPWPMDRPAAFTATSGAASGAVPPDGPARLRACLAGLAGKPVLLHGAGRHTIELAAILAESPARIVGVTDDNPERQGAPLLGWTVLPPERARETGATDVILSSWMHQKQMLARRDTFEAQGIRVHALYDDEPA